MSGNLHSPGGIIYSVLLLGNHGNLDFRHIYPAHNCLRTWRLKFKLQQTVTWVKYISADFVIKTVAKIRLMEAFLLCGWNATQSMLFSPQSTTACMIWEANSLWVALLSCFLHWHFLPSFWISIRSICYAWQSMRHSCHRLIMIKCQCEQLTLLSRSRKKKQLGDDSVLKAHFWRATKPEFQSLEYTNIVVRIIISLLE